MNQVHISKSKYSPEGTRTVTIVLEGDPGKIDPSWAVMTLEDLEERMAIYEKEQKIARAKQELEDKMKDPQKRLEAMRFQRSQLETYIRTLSADIMRTEEAIGDGK